MRALLFHAPAYTADGYDDTRPRLVRAACKGSDNNVERRDIPENGLSVSDWYLRNILYIDELQPILLWRAYHSQNQHK